jgi:hypothetical protein
MDQCKLLVQQEHVEKITKQKLFFLSVYTKSVQFNFALLAFPASRKFQSKALKSDILCCIQCLRKLNKNLSRSRSFLYKQSNE